MKHEFIHKKGKNKFKIRLLWAFGILFTVIAVAVSTLFFYTNYQNARTDEQYTSQIVLDRIATQITSLYEQIDIAATSITKNSNMQQIVLDLNSEGTAADNPAQALQIKREIQHMLTNMLFSSNISNVLLYDSRHDYFYYTGLYLGDRDYIEKAMKKADADMLSEKILKGPHKSPWLKEEKTVLSVIKNFSDNNTTKSTHVEVQVPYSRLEEICRQDSFRTEKEIIILDQEGKMVYPWKRSVSVISEDNFARTCDAVRQGRTEYMGRDYSFYAVPILDHAFSVILLSNNSSLHGYFSSNCRVAVLTFFVLLLPTMLSVAAIINVISKPLQELIVYINRISLEKDTKLQLPANTLDEFEIINSSFNQMLEKMRESVKQIYESRIRETNARLTALQAQINPHFLYNALNSISAASEVYGSEVTTKMCQEFSGMMRYITSGHQTVKLIEEIAHTRNYLDFMKFSYDGDFDYEIDIPLSLYNVTLPKLVIQPLVENSFKHGFHRTAPPWQIKIRCFVQEDCWNVEIRDNGSGFSEAALEQFERSKKAYLGEEAALLYEDLEIDGLGLKNILGRLLIFFNKDVDVNISNEAGSCVVITGKLQDKEGFQK